MIKRQLVYWQGLTIGELIVVIVYYGVVIYTILK
jgi:hypothetical protein